MAGSLSAGVVALQIVADVTGFGNKVHDGTAKELDGQKAKFGGLGKKMGLSLVAGAGAVVGAGMAAIVKTGFGEVKDASAGTAQLEAGLKSTNAVAGTTVDGMNKLAGSIQGYSGQTDDSVVAAESLLLTFTNIRNNGPDKIFDQATAAAADMAAKMGGDASSKAVLLGKALNDPVKGITALTKVGVSFTAAQKDQIKAMVASGDTAGAQKLILKELSTEFGGAAKAAGQSLPGQMERAKRSFEDLSQAIIGALVPVVQPLLEKLPGAITKIGAVMKPVVDFFSAHKAVFVAFAGAIGLIAGAVLAQTIATKINTGVTKAWAFAQNVAKIATKAWAATQWLLNAAMSANPIGLVVIAVLLLVGVFILAWKHSETFRNIVTGAFHAVQAAVGAVVNWVRTNWPLLLAILTGPIGLAVLAITKNWDAIKAGVAAVKDWIVDRFDDLVGFFTGLPGRLSSIFSGLFDGIKDAFRSAVNFVIDGWNGLRFGIPAFKIGPLKIPGVSVDTPNIPRLADGGIVTRPTIAMIGEAGPEAVIPLGGRHDRPNLTVVVNNPLPERASESVPKILRRRAYALGVF